MTEKQTFLVLGTALWGWTVGRFEAHDLLHGFYAAGGRWTDTASNYPINKEPADFGRAETLLAERVRTGTLPELKVICKVGSKSNSGSPDIDLTPHFLFTAHDRYRLLFGTAYRCLMIHWDNRDQPAEINATVQALKTIESEGYDIGLSGVRCPDLYAETLGGILIEIKHNLLEHKAYRHYAAFHGRARFLAYGLNMGGIKMEGAYTPSNSAWVRGVDTTLNTSHFLRIITHDHPHPAWPRSFNQLGMLFAHNEKDVAGLIVGPSSMEQLHETLHYHALLNNHGTADLLAEMKIL
jgi:aryl-alcohol dehydrogenase-like predicted oxidoreductase